jgi:formylmethanofuran dehydrogenase subunit E
MLFAGSSPGEFIFLETFMPDLQTLLDLSASRHSHLCPRQVIGVRLGIAGANALGIEVPQTKKRLLTIVETDGCFADGVEVATGCTLGHRTLRVEDYGKIAATFVDTKLERAVRVAPHLDIRKKAYDFAPHQGKRYFAQLDGYQMMPIDELVNIEEVQLSTPVSEIISRAGVRVNCGFCGEEIINEREIMIKDMALCKSCAGTSYYRVVKVPEAAILWSTVGRQEAIV